MTFNSAGINLNKNIPTDLSNVVNVRLTGDPVSSRLNQLGHTKYEFSNEGNLLPHGIAVVISSLKNSIRIAKPKAIVFQ